MKVNLYPLVRGIASYLLPKAFFKRPGSGGTFSSEYCYSVWLRHLSWLHKNKLFQRPEEIVNVAEIGPGDSLGIGLAALFTGARHYFAFDVIAHANVESNVAVSRDLMEYFKNSKEIPNGSKFLTTNPILEDYSFPSSILSISEQVYKQKHIEIDKALRGEEDAEVSIKYVVPWNSGTHNDIKEIDLIFSQAVMEHVADIDFAYSEMYKWLRPGGIISHQVDFKTHEMTKEWNGHWFISDKVWAILAHGRKYPMNRLPLSSHLRSIERAGFVIKSIIPVNKINLLINQKTKVPGVDFTAEDLVTSSALIQAVKI